MVVVVAAAAAAAVVVVVVVQSGLRNVKSLERVRTARTMVPLVDETGDS
jgi:hypothetical protein